MWGKSHVGITQGTNLIILVGSNWFTYAEHGSCFFLLVTSFQFQEARFCIIWQAVGGLLVIFFFAQDGPMDLCRICLDSVCASRS